MEENLSRLPRGRAQLVQVLAALASRGVGGGYEVHNSDASNRWDVWPIMAFG